MTATQRFLDKKYTVVFIFVTSLFMLWGIAMTMGDILNRHFQQVLHVSKAQSGLIQLSIFGAYGLMSIPAGIFMNRFGYKNGVLLGLILYALGAFLFVPAANEASFSFFRFALFILACGLATLETVAHPFVASLGDERTSDQRINFAQSFNGLGTVLGPLIGGYFILRTESQQFDAPLYTVKMLYICVGIIICLVAVAFKFIKVPHIAHDVSASTDHTKIDYKGLFKHKHFIWATVAQFFNVAAQGGTWAFFIVYGVEKMHLSGERAAYFFSLSMLMMMVGRFVGTWLMKHIAPNKLLAIFALANIVMCLLVAQGWGWISFTALIMINFFFSIMFPTIFSLGLKDLGKHTKQASSFIVMGVVGGAFFPPIMGYVADHDTATAYYLPIICYIVIFLFGFKLYKRAK